MSLKIARDQQPKTAEKNIWCLKVIELFHEPKATKSSTTGEPDKKEYRLVWRTPTSKSLVKPEMGFELERKDGSKASISTDEIPSPSDPRLILSYSLNNLLEIEQFKFLFDPAKVAEYETQLWLCYIPANAIYYEGFNDLLKYSWRKNHLTPKENFHKEFTHHYYYERQYASSSIIFQRQITSYDELLDLMLEQEFPDRDDYLREETLQLESFPEMYDLFCKEGKIREPFHIKELTSYKNIVAFDFETVVYKHEQRACAIGIARVVNGQHEEAKSFLIQPPENYYDGNSTRIHHITQDMTAEAPTFVEVWPTIKAVFDSADVILYHHGGGFDVSVLRNEAEYYHFAFNENDYNFVDTGRIFNCRLTDISKAYKVDTTNHHEASADAIMCLECYLRYIHGIHPDYKILDEAKAEKENYFRKPSEEFMNDHQVLHGSVLQKDLTGADPSNPYYDKKVVISGVFYKADGTKYDRKDIAAKLKECGADIDTSVGKYTQILFAGEATGATKLKRIQELIDSGKDARILGQPEIIKLMES